MQVVCGHLQFIFQRSNSKHVFVVLTRIAQVSASLAAGTASYTLNGLVTGLEVTINVSAISGSVVGPTATLSATPLGPVNSVGSPAPRPHLMIQSTAHPQRLRIRRPRASRSTPGGAPAAAP